MSRPPAGRTRASDDVVSLLWERSSQEKWQLQPDRALTQSSDFIAEGVRAERAGALDRALESYLQAARTSDAGTRAEALRRQADVFIDLADLRTRVGRELNPRDAAERPPRGR